MPEPLLAEREVSRHFRHLTAWWKAHRRNVDIGYVRFSVRRRRWAWRRWRVVEKIPSWWLVTSPTGAKAILPLITWEEP